MMAQATLPLFRVEKDDPQVTRFVDLLLSHGGWLNSREALEALGLEDTDNARRALRAWAEAAESELISGQRGYKHVDKATAEEIGHFCSWMESQGEKMKLRAARTRARAHGRIG